MPEEMPEERERLLSRYSARDRWLIEDVVKAHPTLTVAKAIEHLEDHSKSGSAAVPWRSKVCYLSVEAREPLPVKRRELITLLVVAVLKILLQHNRPKPNISVGRARRPGIKQITLCSDPFDAASRTCNHSTARHAGIGHDAALLTSWRRTAHSRARKSSRARTDGSRPRREGNTAWTMPLRGCHCGRTWTRRPARMSSQIMTVGSCATPTPAKVASRSTAMSSVMRRGRCGITAVWPSLRSSCH